MLSFFYALILLFPLVIAPPTLLNTTFDPSSVDATTKSKCTLPVLGHRYWKVLLTLCFSLVV